MSVHNSKTVIVNRRGEMHQQLVNGSLGLSQQFVSVLQFPIGLDVEVGALLGKRLVQLLLCHHLGVLKFPTQLVDCGKVVKRGGHLFALE